MVAIASAPAVNPACDNITGFRGDGSGPLYPFTNVAVSWVCTATCGLRLDSGQLPSE